MKSGSCALEKNVFVVTFSGRQGMGQYPWSPFALNDHDQKDDPYISRSATRESAE